MAQTPIKYRKRTRTDGVWEIVWTDPSSGKVKRQSCGTRDAHQAERKLAEKILSGDVVPPNVVTVGYLLDRYFQHIKRRKESATVVPMVSKVDRLKSFLGTRTWQDFGQADVENYIDFAKGLTRWSRGERALGEGTIKKDLQILRAALRHAHLMKIVPTETRIEIRNLSSEVRSDWLDESQMRRVFACCEEDDDREHIYAFLLIALATGARKEAIFQLRWDQIYVPETRYEETSMLTHTENSPVHPLKAGRRTKLRTAIGPVPLDFETGSVVSGAYIDFGAGRGNKRRPTIPIGQNQRLMSYILFGGDRSQPYVVSFKGKRIQTGIKRGLETVGVEADLPFKLTHHVLKKTCITWMVRNGIPFDTIERLTNTTVDTLKRHYSQHSPDLEDALGSTFSI